VRKRDIIYHEFLYFLLLLFNMWSLNYLLCVIIFKITAIRLLLFYFRVFRIGRLSKNYLRLITWCLKSDKDDLYFHFFCIYVLVYFMVLLVKYGIYVLHLILNSNLQRSAKCPVAYHQNLAYMLIRPEI